MGSQPGSPGRLRTGTRILLLSRVRRPDRGDFIRPPERDLSKANPDLTNSPDRPPAERGKTVGLPGPAPQRRPDARVRRRTILANDKRALPAKRQPGRSNRRCFPLLARGGPSGPAPKRLTPLARSALHRPPRDLRLAAVHLLLTREACPLTHCRWRPSHSPRRRREPARRTPLPPAEVPLLAQDGCAGLLVEQRRSRNTLPVQGKPGSVAPRRATQPPSSRPPLPAYRPGSACSLSPLLLAQDAPATYRRRPGTG